MSPLIDRSFEGKVAVVTGAASGMGLVTARSFAQAGAAVVLADIDEKAARTAVDDLIAAGHRAIAVRCNVADEAEVAAMVDQTVEIFGRLDAAFNNAGIQSPAVETADASGAEFDRVIAVNLRGPYFLSQAIARHWRERPGPSRLPGGYKLIFVSSISAAMASVNRGDYCVSKAGLAMAAKLWATRLAAEGVQVFEVRPGIMRTDMTAGVKEKYDRMIADGLVPGGRWGTAEDVGRTVAALMGGGLPFSTGDVIYVDGGLHLERL